MPCELNKHCILLSCYHVIILSFRHSFILFFFPCKKHRILHYSVDSAYRISVIFWTNSGMVTEESSCTLYTSNNAHFTNVDEFVNRDKFLVIKVTLSLQILYLPISYSHSVVPSLAISASGYRHMPRSVSLVVQLTHQIQVKQTYSSPSPTQPHALGLPSAEEKKKKKKKKQEQ